MSGKITVTSGNKPTEATTMTVEFKGKLTPAQSQEIVERLKALLRDYKVTDIKEYK